MTAFFSFFHLSEYIRHDSLKKWSYLEQNGGEKSIYVTDPPVAEIGPLAIRINLIYC